MMMMMMMMIQMRMPFALPGKKIWKRLFLSDAPVPFGLILY